MKFDIVIIGGGTAGMACAIEASKNGANIAVIEKDHRLGGAMHWSGGHMSAAGTRLQKRNGIIDSIDEHYDDIIRINNGTGDLDLIHLAVEEAPKTLDWLDELEFPWAPECPRIIYGHIPYTKARTHYGQDKANSIFNTILPLFEEGVAAKNIHCFYAHKFVNLRQKDGKYHEVVCISNGEEKRFEGHNIVLTTGGYGSNPEYFGKKHGNIPLNSSAYPNATGEGIIIMEQLGAVFRMQEYHLPSLGGIEMEPGSGRSNFNEAWAMVLTSVYRRPRDIYVAQDGRRFMNEDEENPDKRERAVVNQSDGKFWVIFDEEALMERDENGNENPIIIGWNTERIKKEASKNQAIFSSDHIEELASLIGINSENLKATISQFNTYVDQNEDPDFGRNFLKHRIQTAPFYAVKVFASVLVTFGGIEVDVDLQVIDKNGYVMKGVYAAGEALGLGATSGSAFCSGMAITPALSFGRILGKQLSQ